MVTKVTDDKASCVQAIASVCVDHALREKIRIGIAQAIWSRKTSAALQQITSAEIRRLHQLAETLREKMTRHKLTDEHRMLPVLWIRLFIEAGLPTEAGAFAWIKELRLSAEGRRPCLYQVKVRKTEQGQTTVSWTGPEVAVEGLKPARGYLFEELLLSSFKKSPYERTWRIVELAPTESSANGSARRQKGCATPKRARAGASTRKCPIQAEYRRMYGATLVFNLETACAKDAAHPTGGILTEGSPSGRPYFADRPAEDVVAHLRKFSQILRNYSASTLQKALRLWVECPRGRPPVGSRPSKRTKTRLKSLPGGMTLRQRSRI